MSRAAEPPPTVFDTIGAEALASQKAPGMVVAVVRDGKLVYVKGFGLADVAHKVPVASDTRFAIGSLTKQFTAVSVLLLAQRRKLGLDDQVSKYVPSFPNASAITVRMLLNQTSGLHNYPFLSERPWPMSGTIALDTLLGMLASDPSDFAPGTRWEYSNANYALLAAVIAKASGLDEGVFLQQNVFDPLKMTSSGFGYAAQRQPGLAKAYQGRAPFQPQPSASLDLFSGAGAVVSNAPDVAAWDIALMQGDLLDPRSMQALWTAGKLKTGAGTGYAMGFVPATLAGHREVWHNGLAPGAGGYCYNAIFPDDKLAVIVLSNGYNFDGVAEQIVSRVLAAYDSSASWPVTIVPPSPAPGEDPAVTRRAKDWFHRLQTGTVDRSRVEPTFAQRLTPAFLAQLRAALVTEGTPTDWVYVGSQTAAGVTVSSYWIRLSGVPHIWSIALTAGGKIAGSQLQ